MTDPDEDFAAMFEASQKVKHIERGQTVEGIVVTIGPEVALVRVYPFRIIEFKDGGRNLIVSRRALLEDE